MLGNVYRTEILAELVNDSVNYDEMARLCMKAARLGNDNCMEYVFGWYREGEEFLSKDDLATTLQAHQAVNDEMKTPGQEFAKRFDQFLNDDNPNIRVTDHTTITTGTRTFFTMSVKRTTITAADHD